MTFVELLMAATMFSILAVGFAAHLRGGVTAWRRATSTLQRLQAIRVARDRLTQDLTNAVVFDPSGAWNPQATFGANELRFYTVQRPWREGAGSRRVVFVTYAIASEGAGSTLTRSVEPAQAAAADMPISAHALLSDVSAWHLRYGYAESTAPGAASSVVWRDEWNHEKPAVPKLIEVTIELADHLAGASSIREVVRLPQGQLGTISN